MLFLALMTSVWPAWWPLGNVTPAATRSVSRSTILPLPSSPHCVPITTTFLPMFTPGPCGRSAADQIEERAAGRHAGEADAADLAARRLRHREEQPLRRRGA